MPQGIPHHIDRNRHHSYIGDLGCLQTQHCNIHTLIWSQIDVMTANNEDDSPNKCCTIVVIVENELAIASELWFMSMARPLVLCSPSIIVVGGHCHRHIRRSETPMDKVYTIECQGFLKQILAG